MSVESSFLKDRPANQDEIQNLEFDTPVVLGQRSYDDLLKVQTVGEKVGKPETIDGIEFQKFKRNNWYFRMN
jgi:hypothetical protein